MAENRESINLKVSAELKRQVVEYAAEFGISTNAAAAILITEGLRAVRRQRDRDQRDG
jgi:hypothetical protein